MTRDRLWLFEAKGAESPGGWFAQGGGNLDEGSGVRIFRQRLG